MENHNSTQDSIAGKVSLIDVFFFLKSAYKIILVFGVVGTTVAVTYLAVTPKKYQAIAQIAMAQIGAANNSNPLGVNIEEPPLLIARLTQPTSFAPETLSSCGMDQVDNSGAELSKSIKLAPLKGAVNVVELRTFGKTPDVASACARAIFELIKTTQAQIALPYIEEAKIKLADDEVRLVKAKALIAKESKLDLAPGATYLSTRDEIRFLLDEIAALNSVVISSQNRATRLIAPIYTGDTPVAPKRWMVLMAGLFCGFLTGLFFAFASLMWARLQGELIEQQEHSDVSNCSKKSAGTGDYRSMG